jgi:hypothetical protein
MPIKIVKDGLAKLQNRLKDLTKDKVFVGVPDGGGRDDGKMTNAQLAYIHENGSPARGIPARPFLVVGVTDSKADILVHMKKASTDILAGKDGAAGLNKAGLVGQAAVKKYIVAGGGFSPLKAQTIKRREASRKSGNAGSKPLIDTGQLLNSITYVVRPK